MSSIGRLLLGKSLVLVSVLMASPATFGEEILLSTSDAPIDGTAWNQGWWSDTRANATTNESPFIGIKDGDHRAFFTFLLPSTLSDTSIVSATLLQSRGASSLDNELHETIGLFDVTTNEDTLNHNVGASSVIYSDLGSGTSFGQFVVPGDGAADTVIEMPLNAAGLSISMRTLAVISRLVLPSFRTTAMTIYSHQTYRDQLYCG